MLMVPCIVLALFKLFDSEKGKKTEYRDYEPVDDGILPKVLFLMFKTLLFITV